MINISIENNIHELKYKNNHYAQDWKDEHWQEPIKFKIMEAVNRYYDSSLDASPEPTPEQIKLLIDYCNYFLHSPENNIQVDKYTYKGLAISLARTKLTSVKTLNQLDSYLNEFLPYHINPF